MIITEVFLDDQSNIDLNQLTQICIKLGLVKDPENNEAEKKLIEDLNYILRDYEGKGESDKGIIVQNLKEVIMCILKLTPIPEEDYNDVSLELKEKEERTPLRTFKFDVDDNIILKKSDHKWLRKHFSLFPSNRADHLKNQAI